jgi:hypothetical protein
MPCDDIKAVGAKKIGCTYRGEVYHICGCQTLAGDASRARWRASPRATKTML